MKTILLPLALMIFMSGTAHADYRRYCDSVSTNTESFAEERKKGRTKKQVQEDARLMAQQRELAGDTQTRSEKNHGLFAFIGQAFIKAPLPAGDRAVALLGATEDPFDFSVPGLKHAGIQFALLRHQTGIFLYLFFGMTFFSLFGK